jgi:DNA-binding NarL/FixJ family response regulator
MTKTGHRNLTFVIADDDQMVRTIVKTILEEHGFHKLGETSDGEEAVRLCRDLRPDVALLDLSMPLLNGIDAARDIIKDYPATKIIVLTEHTERPYILETLRAGVAGYLTKDKAASNLPEAIDAVCKGETYVRASGFQEIA